LRKAEWRQYAVCSEKIDADELEEKLRAALKEWKPEPLIGIPYWLPKV
jgi:hypothetical protein